MFNKVAKKQKTADENLTKERNKRCFPAAKAILELSVKGRIDDVDPSEMFDDYSPLVRDIMDVMMKHDIKLGEINYVFQLAMLPMDVLKEMVSQSMDKHLSTAEKMFWGKEGNDVTVKELDERLKQG